MVFVQYREIDTHYATPSVLDGSYDLLVGFGVKLPSQAENETGLDPILKTRLSMPRSAAWMM